MSITEFIFEDSASNCSCGGAVVVDRWQSHIKSIEREVGKPVRALKGGEDA